MRALISITTSTPVRVHMPIVLYKQEIKSHFGFALKFQLGETYALIHCGL